MHSHFEVPPRSRIKHLLSLSTLVVATASCSSDPTGTDCNLTSLEIAGLQEVLTSGESLQLTADFEANTCTPAIEWSASPGITINQSGLLVADQIGGPFTITAMAGGLTATGEISVATGPAVADSRWAVAWTDLWTNPDYILDHIWEYSSGGNIRSTRTGVGAYTLTFAGLAAQTGQKQSVMVSAYMTDEPSRCRVLSTANQGPDLVVQVRCHNLAGVPVDSMFDLAVVPAGSLTGRSAFMVSSSPDGGVIPAATAYSSSLQPIHVTREAVGRYTVLFEGLSRSFVGGSGPEHLQLSANGDGTSWCKIAGWTSLTEDLTVDVRCFTPAGAASDATFSVLLVERGRTGKRAGFVWASNHTSAVPYTPLALYNFNSAGTPNTAVRTSTGVYVVTWTGLGRIGSSTAETNLITAYGSDSTYCQVDGWAGTSTTFLCFAPNGTPTDSQFNAVWIE